jgi:hypothetical protein
MLLTKHEDQTFTGQTIYISGQAFIRCNFIACTLVLRETVYHMEDCSFDRCNWHIDTVLLWGSPESVREMRAVVTLLEQGLAQLQAQQAGQQGTAPAGGTLQTDEGTDVSGGGGPTPFA